MLIAFAQVALIILAYMTGVFIIAIIKKDNSIVDIAWGIGFILIALFSLFTQRLFLPRHLLITSMIVIWGLRISLHIAVRNWGKGEDPRYAVWRKQWRNNIILRSFLQVFMLQGIILLIIASPIIVINTSTNQSLGMLDLTGLLVWLIGFVFEATGDYQLHRFISNPANRGEVMTQGLWRYTRHPNYFGESVMWWGIWLIAFSVPYGWATIVSPMLITFLLLFVSGIPLAEKQFAGDAQYEAYKKRTSVFIPWLPKK